jgi:hypothetical protein
VLGCRVSLYLYHYSLQGESKEDRGADHLWRTTPSYSPVCCLKQQEQESDRYNGWDNDPQVLRQSRPLPENLPREIHRLEPAESCCPGCGSDMAYLSEVSAEQLELVSSALKVIRIVRVKKAGT